MATPLPGRTGSIPLDVVLPVLDERDALPWVLGRLPPGCRAIVVDNGSSDGSADLARTLGATVVHEPQKGFGAACYAGLVAADAELVAFMDCDGSLDPQDLERAVALLIDGPFDLVTGARRADPGAWPVHARLANRYLARRLRRRFGFPLTDLGPLRLATGDA